MFCAGALGYFLQMRSEGLFQPAPKIAAAAIRNVAPGVGAGYVQLAKRRNLETYAHR
jgi:hypothetical protein